MFFQEAYVNCHSFPLLLKAMLQSKKDNQINCPFKQNLFSPFGHVKDAIHLCLPENLKAILLSYVDPRVLEQAGW